MSSQKSETFSAFDGHKLLCQDALAPLVLKVKRRLEEEPKSSILIFSNSTGKQMDFDWSGSESEVLARLQVFISQEEESAATGPGRPKLGVVAREVSLLPRHWEWLSTVPGGASAALRRLVEEARIAAAGKETISQAQERTYRFMHAIAGDLPHYEEALRALYAKDAYMFGARIAKWPKDIRAHAETMSKRVFE